MNQTRVFLIFAWLMVAVLLGMEWSREKNAPDPATVVAAQPAVPAANDADLAPPPASDVPPASVPGTAEEPPRRPRRWKQPPARRASPSPPTC